MSADIDVALTVCVIGRNRASDVQRLGKSLGLLDHLAVSYEKIYVDSASTDDSVEIARFLFDRTLVLADSPYLSASAGRFVGTVHARGEWILYLDSDMAVHPDWVEVLEAVCSQPAGSKGYVGLREDIFPDGSSRQTSPMYRGLFHREALFGGAVLLPRAAVLAAGNWRPGIFSNEELDLYVRLRTVGCTVDVVRVQAVSHFTQRLSPLQRLLGILVPTKAVGNKFYGFGQVLRAHTADRTTIAFIRAAPEPFVLWAAWVVTLGLVIAGQPLAGTTIAVSTGVFFWRRYGARYLVIFTAQLLFQSLGGWFRYNPDYVPEVQREVRSPRRHDKSGGSERLPPP